VDAAFLAVQRMVRPSGVQVCQGLTPVGKGGLSEREMWNYSLHGSKTSRVSPRVRGIPGGSWASRIGISPRVAGGLGRGILIQKGVGVASSAAAQSVVGSLGRVGSRRIMSAGKVLPRVARPFSGIMRRSPVGSRMLSCQDIVGLLMIVFVWKGRRQRVCHGV